MSPNFFNRAKKFGKKPRQKMNERRNFRREDAFRLDVSSSSTNWVKLEFMADPFNSNRMNPHYAYERNGKIIILTSSEITLSMDQFKVGIRPYDLKIIVSKSGHYQERHTKYGMESYIAVLETHEIPMQIFRRMTTKIRNNAQPLTEFFINKTIVDMICGPENPDYDGTNS